jgi:hypothetical protein
MANFLFIAAPNLTRMAMTAFLASIHLCRLYKNPVPGAARFRLVRMKVTDLSGYVHR